jgi:hypothetical protein
VPLSLGRTVPSIDGKEKGLGRIIMATLANLSIAQEARIGVLVATEQGRALYQAIGWTLVSPVTAAVIA